jgi:hypothetical protein
VATRTASWAGEMINYPNKPGIRGLRKPEIEQVPMRVITQREEKLEDAKSFLAEIGGARPGVLTRWLESREAE